MTAASTSRPQTVCLFTCEYYRNELASFSPVQDGATIVTANFPSRATHARVTWDDLRNQADGLCPGWDTLLAVGGPCVSALGDPPADDPRCIAHPFHLCTYLAASRNIVDEALRQGAAVLTPGWLDTQGNRAALPADPCNPLLHSRPTKLVLLDTGQYPDTQEKLQTLADDLGVPHQILPAGTDYFNQNIQNAIFQSIWKSTKPASLKWIHFPGEFNPSPSLPSSSPGNSIMRSEMNFQRFFEEMLSGFSLWEIEFDSQGHPVDYRYLEVNKVWEKITGYSAEQAIGHTLRELFPHLEQSWLDQFAHVVQTRESIQVQQFSQDLKRWFEARFFSPQPHLIAALFYDITEHRNTREALLHERDLLLRAEKVSRSGNWAYHIKWNLLFASEGAKAICGLADGSIPYQSIRKLILPEDRPIMDEALHGLIEEGKPYAIEHRIERPSDRQIITLRSTAEYDKEQQVVFGVIQDVTYQKIMEEELSQTITRLRSIIRLLQLKADTVKAFLDAMLDEIIILTGSKIGYIFHYDHEKREFRLHAWSTGAMKECNVAEIRTIYPLDHTGVWGEPIRQRKPIILNNFHAHHPAKKGFPAGHVQVDRFLAIPVFYQDTIVATVGVANKESDYTEIDCLHLTLLSESVWIHIEQMKIEQERAHLQQQLLQSQKMEAVGRLAGGVAHDFNNMLGVIIGHTDLALLHTQDDDPLRKDLNQIRNAANRSADLTRQLLAYARKQIAKPKVVNLNSLVETMQQMLRRLISEDIDLLWIPGEDLWPVRIDPAQVDQIVANLVVNARDAVDSAGSITIQTRNISVQEFDQIDHPERVPGDYVLLTVRDTGMGMSPETLERIFEPFYTTKEQGRGTGLGLATVYGIVRQNEGFIDVESVSGQGSCFSVYLRRHIDPQVAKEGSPAEPHLASGHETILLVEDEEVVLRLAQQMLEHLGYTVFTARTAGEAITRMREQAGAIDLLVTDVIMPSMNGRELKEQLETLHPGLKCLYMSGYPADVIARQGVLDEEIQFIPKPFTLNSLSEKVHLALNQK